MRRYWLVVFAASQLPAAADSLSRMSDARLTYAQRNDACFSLRGNGSPEVRAAMRRALSSEELRACAARNLREAGAVSELENGLADADPDVRIAAVRELGSMRRMELAPLLTQTALDVNPLVAANAVNALAQIGDRRMLPYLLEIAGKGHMAGVAALEQASHFNDPAILPIARNYLTEADVAARVIAVRVIGEMGDRSDLPSLREMAAKAEPLSQNGRGFGLMPNIDLGRVARNAIQKIEARTRMSPY